MKLYFPTLLVRQKWHHPKRNLKVGDICVLQDSNAFRGEFRLCRVSEVYPDSKGVVRNVEVTVAAKQDGSAKYTPQSLSKLKRHVNNLIVIHAVDDDAVESRNSEVHGTVVANSKLVQLDSDCQAQVSCVKDQFTAPINSVSTFRKSLVVSLLSVAE